VQRLDAFQMSKVVAHYPSVTEARKAIQQNDIYAFLYIPKGTTDDLLASRQPKVSFYYSYTTLASGALLMRDLKTISTLGSAAVGQATMRAKGFTDAQIQAFLQPIRIDLHQIANPWTSYNSYLSTMMVPGMIMLFIFLISAYSLGTELKFDSSKEWMEMANGNILVAIVGKFLPQTLIFLAIVYGYEWYIYGWLGFPQH
jgi:ABC-2 type transport system permease protein